MAEVRVRLGRARSGGPQPRAPKAMDGSPEASGTDSPPGAWLSPPLCCMRTPIDFSPCDRRSSPARAFAPLKSVENAIEFGFERIQSIFDLQLSNGQPRIDEECSTRDRVGKAEG